MASYCQLGGVYRLGPSVIQVGNPGDFVGHLSPLRLYVELLCWTIHGAACGDCELRGGVTRSLAQGASVEPCWKGCRVPFQSHSFPTS